MNCEILAVLFYIGEGGCSYVLYGSMYMREGAKERRGRRGGGGKKGAFWDDKVVLGEQF
jgi:hypothetical protein